MMRRIIYLLIALIALSGKAHAWTQQSSFTPSGGPVSAGAAGSSFNGSLWVDQGGYWSVDSGNHALVAPPPSGSPWNVANLYRPSGEGTVNSRTIVKFVSQGSGQADLYIFSRFSTSGGTGTGYTVGFSPGGAVHFYSISGGSLNGQGNPSLGYSQTAGVAYQYVMDTSTLNSTTTTITATLEDATGNVLGTPQSVNDSTYSLQGVSGVAALFEPTNSMAIDPLVTQIYTCSGTAGDGGAGCGVASYAQNVTISPASASVFANGSQNFTVNLDGPVPSGDSVTVTLFATVGTLSPSALTFTANTAQTVTLTAPGAAGSGTITGTHTVSGSTALTLADFSAVAVTVPASSLIGVTSPAIHFSPANWHGDTGRGGSVYRQAWTSGAYFNAVWTAGPSPTAILNFPSNSSAAQLACFLNGVLTDNISTNGNYTLTGLTAGAAENLLCYVKRSTASVSRWGTNNGGVLHITGILLDSGSTPGTAPVPTKWGILNGDSIDEGDVVDGGVNNFLKTSSFMVMQQLFAEGYDVSMQASSGTGFLIPTDTPALYYVSGGAYDAAQSRWSLEDAGVSLLDSAGQISAYGATGTTPAFIFLRYGGNDCNNGSIALADLTSSVQGTFTSYRAAAPAAKLVYMPDFPILAGVTTRSGCLAAINAGISAYQAAHSSDTAFSEVQIPLSFANQLYGNGSYYLSNSLHPNVLGDAVSAPFIQNAIDSAFATTITGTMTTTVSGPIRLGL